MSMQLHEFGLYIYLNIKNVHIRYLPFLFNLFHVKKLHLNPSACIPDIIPLNFVVITQLNFYQQRKWNKPAVKVNATTGNHNRSSGSLHNVTCKVIPFYHISRKGNSEKSSCYNFNINFFT